MAPRVFILGIKIRGLQLYSLGVVTIETIMNNILYSYL
jgi:hypothetical protein